MNYCELLKTKRTEKNLSRQQLATLTGYTRHQIRRWETGEQGMTIKSADKVFKALGISIIIGEGNNEINT